MRYALIAGVIFFSVLFLLSPRRPAIQDLRVFHHTPAHTPPVQKNSTSGEVRWYSDWKWLKPFSASITLDEDRSVLPPLKIRPPIYTFYDAEEKKDEKIRAAENKLILQWRRAWWAQGFRPVVLGKSEAMHHPDYYTLKTHDLQPQMETDLMRWLAWGQMGTGILANWLIYPMGDYNEHLLSSLRKGEYEKLTRYEGLDSGLFSGEKTAVNGAITEALSSSKLKESKSVLEAVSRLTLKVAPMPTEIAFYDARTNAENYKSITALLGENKAEGLESLANLINSHLQLTFMNNFPDGLEVLMPYPDSTTVLVQRAYSLAEALRSCPTSPIPSSCPPNRQKCKPCASADSIRISTPTSFTNSTKVYTIGSVPHPYTLASLKGKVKELTTRYIRRDTSRDPWLDAVTIKTLDKGLGGQGRIVSFKEMVASDWGSARSLWMTEDQPLPHKSMEYHFGFSLPPFNTTTPSEIKIPLPKPGTAGDSSPPAKDTKSNARNLKLQSDLLTAAQKVLQQDRTITSIGSTKKKKDGSGTREMVEAWNLADTEAWRFVRAFAARETVERRKWEQEERRFAGADASKEGESEGAWRWFDRS